MAYVYMYMYSLHVYVCEVVVYYTVCGVIQCMVCGDHIIIIMMSCVLHIFFRMWRKPL